MWNNLFMGLWILQNKKKNLQHFYHLDRPGTTRNLFFQGTRCKTWETYTAERFTKPWAGGGWDLHTWNSSGFHSFIVEMQKQNVSWDKTDITIYSKYPHLRWVFTALFFLYFVLLIFCLEIPHPICLSLRLFFCFLSHHHNLASALRSCWGGYGWVCSYLRSGKKVWVVLNLPTAKVRWEKISRMVLGLVSKCPSGMQGQIHRTGKQPWASSKHHRCLSRS